MPDIFCQQKIFSELADGTVITRYTLRNPSGMSVSMINYGATLISAQIPDSRNALQELVIGFDSLDDYLNHDFYSGSTIGRVANRIGHAEFSYQDHHYLLTHNNDRYPHHLHGGQRGLDKVIWHGEVLMQRDAAGVIFSYTSVDGDQGYPGNLSIQVVYLLTLANELKISFRAETDRPTPVDLTNHAYWNLAGAGQGSILDHILQINAEEYVVTDSELIATGEIASVRNTVFDFRKPQRIGDRISALTELPTGGYDLCYVLNQGKELKLSARVKEPVSSRILEVYTTQPGLQFYTGNNLNHYPIRSGLFVDRHGAFCLETQNFPNAVHHPNFPSPFLLPDQIYHHETIYKIIW